MFVPLLRSHSGELPVKKIRVEPGEESEARQQEEEYYCEVCGKEISEDEYEAYDGMCWECWDDQMTEECEFEEGII